MKFDNRRTPYFVLLLLAAALLFTLGSSSIPFLSSDEPRYAQVAREMLRSHEYFVPSLAGLAWYEKPILLYWLMVASFRMLGVNEFAARLPSALAALATIIVVYVAVKKLTDEKRALICSLILTTSAFFLVFSHAANFDMLLTCFITITFCSYLFLQMDHKSRFFLYGMYLATALGVLTKGFVAVILPVFSISAYLILTRRTKEIVKMKPGVGLLIVTAVSAIWFLPISFISGRQFWEVFLYQHQVVRYATGLSRTEGTFFYVPVLLLGTFPWTLTPFLSFGSSRIGPEKKMTQLCLCWLFGTLLFFSFSKTQLPSYVLPAVPPFSILGGLSLIDYFEKTTGAARRITLVIGLMNALVLLAIFWLSRKFSLPSNSVLTFVVAVEIISATTVVFALMGKLVTAVCVYSLLPLAGMIVFFYLLLPQIHWGESKTLSLAISPQLIGNHKLVQYDMGDYAPLFYTDGRVEMLPDGHLYILSDPEQFYRYLSRKKSAYVLLDNSDLEWINRDQFWRIFHLIHGRELSVLELRLPSKGLQPHVANP